MKLAFNVKLYEGKKALGVAIHADIINPLKVALMLWPTSPTDHLHGVLAPIAQALFQQTKPRVEKVRAEAGDHAFWVILENPHLPDEAYDKIAECIVSACKKYLGNTSEQVSVVEYVGNKSPIVVSV